MIHCLSENVSKVLASQASVPTLENCIIEIVQNSIDAGASIVKLDVDFQNLGFSVSDDGVGMAPADLEKLGLKGYTSKLSTVTDLRAINTFGFRGEAVASISQLSLVTITSRARGFASGYTIRIKEGRKIAGYMDPGEFGTRVKVSNLFSNMPARRRQKVGMTKLKDALWPVLSTSNVQFSCFEKNNKRVSVRGGDIVQVAKALGPGVGDHWETVNAELDGTKMHGVVAEEGKAQLILVNRRKLVNAELYRKVAKKWGTFVLVFDTQLSEHELIQSPAKEIFDTKIDISQLIFGTAEQFTRQKKSAKQVALSNIRSSSSPNTITQSRINFQPATKVNASIIPPKTQPSPASTVVDRFEMSRYFTPGYNDTTPIDQKVHRDSLKNSQVLAQLHCAFIMVKLPTVGGGKLLALIDQHAADERVNVEQGISDFIKFPKQPVKIAFVKVGDVASEYLPLFRQWGVYIEGDVVTHVPSLAVKKDAKFIADMVRDHVDNLDSGYASKIRLPTMLPAIRAIPSKLLQILNSNACRSAIMFGDELSLERCENLIFSLSKCELPFQCAHGRPSIAPIAQL